MNLITIIIPTYKHDNRLNDLSKLIQTLLVTSNNKYIEEILIIDNGNSLIINSDDSKFLTHKKIRIIDEPQIGLSYARNAGVINTKTNIIAFLDDDVIVSEFWAKNIIRGYSRNNDVFCVGGPVLVNDKENKKYPAWFSDYFLRFILPPHFPKQSGNIQPPYYLIGANISFKKEIFEKFGLFDPTLGRKGLNLLSNEDIEFLTRIPPNQIWYEPGAIVSEKIKEKRLTKMFMMRRLFWQGISDYIMVKKGGLKNFYDNKEVHFTTFLFKKLIFTVKKLCFFEALCMLIRLFSYKFGNFYTKKES
jgi:glycosyltransferase involved in cell wall biosynthesis